MSQGSHRYPGRVVMYVVAMFTVSIGALVVTYFYPRVIDWLSFSLFLLLSIAAELLTVDIPGGYGVSVGFAVNFAAITIMGPFGGALVGGLSVLVGEISREKKVSVPVVFNISQIIIASSLSGMVYVILGGAPRLGRGVTEIWMAFVGLAVVYFVVNATIVTGIISLQQKLSFWRVWTNTMRWLIMNYLALAPLGLLVAVLYVGPLGIGGVVLLLIPLYLARYSFQQYALIKGAHIDTIQALAAALDAKDTYTRGHSERVADMAVKLARGLHLPEETIERIHYAGLLHDIGKIGVHDEILNKIGRLEDQDFVHIQEHPVIGANMLRQVRFLSDVSTIIRHHHEWYDGHGYPDGISGSQIPIESRIMAVADAFDAMTSNRVYRRGMSQQEAIAQLVVSKGTQFDPAVVEAFVKLMSESLEKEDEGVAD